MAYGCLFLQKVLKNKAPELPSGQAGTAVVCMKRSRGLPHAPRHLRVSPNIKEVIGQWHCRTVDEFVDRLAQNNVVTLNRLADEHSTIRIINDGEHDLLAACAIRVGNVNLTKLIDCIKAN